MSEEAGKEGAGLDARAKEAVKVFPEHSALCCGLRKLPCGI